MAPPDVEVNDADNSNNNGFACALCSKVFARRDLRNRHRRRCEKNINKVRVSKKRSCNACSNSKLKCDLMQPSCSRCVSRQMPCQYPNDAAAQAVAQQNAAAMRHASISTLNTDLGMLNDDFITNHSFPPSGPPTAPMTGYSTPLAMHPLSGQQSPIFTSVMDDMMLDLPLEEAFSRSSAGFWDSPSMGMLPNDAGLPDPFSQSCNLQNAFPLPALGNPAEDSVFTSPVSANIHFMNNPEMAFDQKIPGTTFGFDTPVTQSPINSLPDNMFPMMSGNNFQMGMATSHPSPMTRQPSTTSSSPGDTGSHIEFLSDPSKTLPTPAPSRTASISSLDQYNMKLQSAYRLMFHVSEAATIVCNYPKEMMEKTHQSPYVHRELCHSSRLTEPVSTALFCVSSARAGSSALANETIDAQCDKLFGTFQEKQMDLDETSVYVHALCIYQIESMLSLRESRQRTPTNSAKLHQSSLLKMAHAAFRSQSHILRNTNTHNLDFRTWTAVESLRRNLFLVNMINDLSFATKTLSSVYYEPLDKDLLLDLPLPAPEAMWKSMSSSEWMQARDQSRWAGDGVLTLGQAMSKLNHAETLNDLEPLQKLVVSCALARLQ